MKIRTYTRPTCPNLCNRSCKPHPDAPIIFVGQSMMRPEAHPTKSTSGQEAAVAHLQREGVKGLAHGPGDEPHRRRRRRDRGRRPSHRPLACSGRLALCVPSSKKRSMGNQGPPSTLTPTWPPKPTTPTRSTGALIAPGSTSSACPRSAGGGPARLPDQYSSQPEDERGGARPLEARGSSRIRSGR